MSTKQPKLLTTNILKQINQQKLQIIFVNLMKQQKQMSKKYPSLDISALDSNQSACSQSYTHNRNSTNQNESLLVTSSLKNDALQYNQHNKSKQFKVQGKFNNKIANKTGQNAHQINKVKQIQTNQVKFKDNCAQGVCQKCDQKIKKLQIKLKQNQLRLQKLQAVVNISYTKHMHQQTVLSDTVKQFEGIKHFIWQSKKRQIKQRQTLTANQINLKKQMCSVKEAIQKLSKKVISQSTNNRQLSQMENMLLNQKLDSCVYNCDKKTKDLITMIQEVTKLQHKIVIQKGQEQMKQNISIGKLTKNKEKLNKISYYLSKSICNQSTIIGDSSININANYF